MNCRGPGENTFTEERGTVNSLFTVKVEPPAQQGVACARVRDGPASRLPAQLAAVILSLSDEDRRSKIPTPVGKDLNVGCLAPTKPRWQGRSMLRPYDEAHAVAGYWARTK